MHDVHTVTHPNFRLWIGEGPNLISYLILGHYYFLLKVNNQLSASVYQHNFSCYLDKSVHFFFDLKPALNRSMSACVGLQVHSALIILKDDATLLSFTDKELWTLVEGWSVMLVSRPPGKTRAVALPRSPD